MSNEVWYFDPLTDMQGLIETILIFIQVLRLLPGPAVEEIQRLPPGLQKSEIGFKLLHSCSRSDDWWQLFKCYIPAYLEKPLLIVGTYVCANVNLKNKAVTLMIGILSLVYRRRTSSIERFSIGHFRVLFCLCFKTSPSAKPFIWKWVLLTSPFECKSYSFSYERFRTWTRFETEAEGNSEMAYWVPWNQNQSNFSGARCSKGG